MTAALLALLLFSSIAGVRFALLRRSTGLQRFLLEPEGRGDEEGPGEPAGDAPRAGPAADRAGASPAERVRPDGGAASFPPVAASVRPAGGAASFPPVAVIVPVRDEAERLEEALASLAALDYPDYRVIVVDGGLADARIVREFCGRSDRFRCLAAAERPDGWSERTWALECGLREAREPWALFAGAAVVHHPASLSRAMERARRSGADLVSVVPRFICEGFWERLILPAFLAVAAHRFPVERVRDPRSRTAAAAGDFLLVRRAALEAAGGLSPVRARVAEGIAIARRMKRGGARIDLSCTRRLAATRLYSSFGEIAEGLGRPAREATADSAPLLVLAVAVAWIAAVLPFAVLFGLGVVSPLLGLPPIEGPFPQTQGVVCAIAAANYVGMKRLYEEWVDLLDVPFGYAWGYPLAALFYGLIALRAAISPTTSERASP